MPRGQVTSPPTTVERLQHGDDFVFLYTSRRPRRAGLAPEQLRVRAWRSIEPGEIEAITRIQGFS